MSRFHSCPGKSLRRRIFVKIDERLTLQRMLRRPKVSGIAPPR
ncbi:MAG: hypothetical protein OXU61_04225 [Gammaproteobacteria bacterium]|nr:hypothetical protein [Gammaproteobacteria bacterium]